MPTRVISVRGRDRAALLAALLALAPPLVCECHVRVEIDSRETAPAEDTLPTPTSEDPAHAPA